MTVSTRADRLRADRLRADRLRAAPRLHPASRRPGGGLRVLGGTAFAIVLVVFGLASAGDPARDEHGRSPARAPAPRARGAGERGATPLDRFVQAPDPAFAYRHVSEFAADGCRAHVLELTSGTWRSPAEVDRTVWKHWMTVYVPPAVAHRTALISIGGGRSTDPPPTKPHAALARIAAATRSVVVHLQQVPNQPLVFAGETAPRREDALIAYAWDRYLRTGDAGWVPRLPMTRAVVRAMDAAIDWCARPESGGHAIDAFVASGSSKRGWTVWTAAAVDRRIVAIVPMVIDLLNVEASFAHHYRSYGAWSPAIKEFVDLGIPGWLGTREFLALRRVEDPYLYRERLALPKLIMNATGDPFFLPDSSRFYFGDLPGEKHLRYVPNADHSLNGTDVYDTIQAFYQRILEAVPRPESSWSFVGARSIRLRTEGALPPAEVRLWQAANAKARDFRMSSIGAAWTSTLLAPRSAGVYVGSVERPAQGWKAFFLEMSYPGAGGGALKVTTAVRIVPDAPPYSRPPTRPRSTGDRQR